MAATGATGATRPPWADRGGELLYFEKGMGDGVPILPGAHTTSRGDHNDGCTIWQSDSRVVCWGKGEYEQFDPPTE